MAFYCPTIIHTSIEATCELQRNLLESTPFRHLVHLMCKRAIIIRKPCKITFLLEEVYTGVNLMFGLTTMVLNKQLSQPKVALLQVRYRAM